MKGYINGKKEIFISNNKRVVYSEDLDFFLISNNRIDLIEDNEIDKKFEEIKGENSDLVALFKADIYSKEIYIGVQKVLDEKFNDSFEVFDVESDICYTDMKVISKLINESNITSELRFNANLQRSGSIYGSVEKNMPIQEIITDLTSVGKMVCKLWTDKEIRQIIKSCNMQLPTSIRNTSKGIIVELEDNTFYKLTEYKTLQPITQSDELPKVHSHNIGIFRELVDENTKTKTYGFSIANYGSSIANGSFTALDSVDVLDLKTLHQSDMTCVFSKDKKIKVRTIVPANYLAYSEEDMQEQERKLKGIIKTLCSNTTNNLFNFGKNIDCILYTVFGLIFKSGKDVLMYNKVDDTLSMMPEGYCTYKYNPFCRFEIEDVLYTNLSINDKAVNLVNLTDSISCLFDNKLNSEEHEPIFYSVISTSNGKPFKVYGSKYNARKLPSIIKVPERNFTLKLKSVKRVFLKGTEDYDISNEIDIARDIEGFIPIRMEEFPYISGVLSKYNKINLKIADKKQSKGEKEKSAQIELSFSDLYNAKGYAVHKKYGMCKLEYEEVSDEPKTENKGVTEIVGIDLDTIRFSNQPYIMPVYGSKNAIGKKYCKIHSLLNDFKSIHDSEFRDGITIDKISNEEIVNLYNEAQNNLDIIEEINAVAIINTKEYGITYLSNYYVGSVNKNYLVRIQPDIKEVDVVYRL